MLTNQVIQKTIQDIKRVSGYEISLWGADGESMASSASESETLKDKVKSFIEDSEWKIYRRERMKRQRYLPYMQIVHWSM